jgi:hypothetical protein
MSLSGSNTGALRPYTARELVEEATSRAGIKPTDLTTEIIEKSLDQMNLLFTSLVTRGVQLWKRQKMVLPCYRNEARVPLPPGVNLVDKLTRRSLNRAGGGVPFSTAGGDPALAFDGIFETTCQQTATDGALGMIFDQPIQITTVGVLFATAMEVTVFFEYTLDGSSWRALEAVSGTVSAGQWVWTDLDGAPQALGWRIRVVSQVFLNVAELYFGYNPQEVILGPWNLDEYNGMPNKTQGGRVVNYYQQRDLSAPNLLVWPVPDQSAQYDQLVVWVREYLEDVTSMTQSLDVPRRWYDAVTAMLAERLCRSLPEADYRRLGDLKDSRIEAVELAEGEERDPANTNIDMGLSAYTA